MLSHAMVHVYELSIPIFMVIWLTEFSVTTAVLGAVVSIGYGLFGVGALPAGVLADKFRARNLVAVCLVGMGSSFLLLSFAQNVVMIVVALCVWGAAASIYHPTGLALISKGVEARGTGFAFHGMAGNLGIALGPLLTAVLLLFFDWRLVSVLLALPAGVVVVYAFSITFDETTVVQTTSGEVTTEREVRSLGEFVSDSKILFTGGFVLAFFAVMMNGLFYRSTLTFLPDVLSGVLPPVTNYFQVFGPESQLAGEFDLASYVYSGLLLVGIGGQYVAGKLTDRIHPEAGLAAVFGVLALVAVVFVPASKRGTTMTLLVSALLGFLIFALQPLYQATIAEYSPPDERGLSYGYTYLGTFGIGAAGAAIAGYLLTVLTVGETFTMLAVFPLIGALLAGALWWVEET
ncbi:MFS transporter [Halobellus rufus]|uniref:MFS transporter n=1 Tax=Halobellus rufus TaxID=1448860 RepID=UPI0018CEEAC0|nr:MFS transporter [Halobellus rufus]